jgi:hypothetical protein
MFLSETRSSFLAALGLAVFAAGCASQGRIDTETTPAADFSARHTFAWQESQASYDPKPKPQDVELVKAAIHEAVVTQLAQKGYSEASSRTPDFLVSFHLVVTETAAPDLCVQRQVIFDWPGRGDTYEICQRDTIQMNRTVRKGTLVVFVVDAATRSLLWQGIADQAAGSRSDQIEKLRSAVERMFVTFPAQSA